MLEHYCWKFLLTYDDLGGCESFRSLQANARPTQYLTSTTEEWRLYIIGTYGGGKKEGKLLIINYI